MSNLWSLESRVRAVIEKYRPCSNPGVHECLDELQLALDWKPTDEECLECHRATLESIQEAGEDVAELIRRRRDDDSYESGKNL